MISNYIPQLLLETVQPEALTHTLEQIRGDERALREAKILHGIFTSVLDLPNPPFTFFPDPLVAPPESDLAAQLKSANELVLTLVAKNKELENELKNHEFTSASVAKDAAAILDDPTSSKRELRVAGSALTQVRPKKKKTPEGGLIRF